jgi:aspartate-semialdehyde dehydrogenase
MLFTSPPRLAIVGATGAVGQELLRLIDERDFPYASLALVASSRSAGRTIELHGKRHLVHDLETFPFHDVDLAFFSAGTATSRAWAAKAAAEGALVIDNTNAFRMDPASPLVVPQVNGHLLAKRPSNGIVANPNCSTIQMVRALAPIARRFGLTKVVAATYQAASGGGLTGMEELRDGVAATLAGGTSTPQRFPRELAFNVIPQIDVLQDDGYTLEERKMLQETRKILAAPTLDVTATCVRVPVLNGHSVAVYAECETPVTQAGLEQALRDAEELDLYAADAYPTPRRLSSRDRVHVGRLRTVATEPRAFWAWVVADNLRIGAALNAIQIAERVTAPRLRREA